MKSNTGVFNAEGICLYAYQMNTVEKIIGKLNGGAKGLFVLAPAGSGKSIMVLALANQLTAINNNRVLILVHNKALEKQYLDRCKDLVNTQISITTFQNAIRYNIKSGIKNNSIDYSHIIMDEFQDYSDESRAYIKNTSAKVITFSSVNNELTNYNGQIPVIEVNEILSLNKNDLIEVNETELISLKSQLEYYIEVSKNDKLEIEGLRLEIQRQSALHQNEKQEYKEKLNKLELQQFNYENIIDKLEAISGDIKLLHSRVGQVEIKIDSGFEKISAEIKDYYEMIDTSLIHLQEEVSLKLATNIDEAEKIYHEFSETLMIKLMENCFKSELEYKKEKQLLIDLFAEANWIKLSEKSMEYLITSRIVYNYLLSFENHIDFSPVCIAITKALENELYLHLFKKFKQYCKTENIPKSEWPDGLTNFYGSNFYELEDYNFTLGKIPFIIGTKEDNRRPRRAKPGKSIFFDYCNKRLLRNDIDLENESLNRYFDQFDEDVRYITKEYRNQAAHKDEIRLRDAEKCFNYIVAVTKVLVNFIEKIN